MLEAFFQMVLYMSFSGGVLVLVVLCLKAVFRNRIPAFVWMILWLLVAVRLLLPVKIESNLSLFNLDLLRKVEDFITDSGFEKGIKQGYIINERLDVVDDGLRQNHPKNNQASKHTSEILVPQGDSASHASMVDTLLVDPFRDVQINSILPLVWLSGFGVCFVFLTFAYLSTWKRISASMTCSSDDILAMVDEYSKILGLRRHVKVYISDWPGAPCTFGIFKPRLVLPLSFRENLNDGTNTNKSQMRHIMLHELCHVMRCDNIANLVYLFAACVHWFNPIVWYALFKFRADMEAACDEAVLKRIPGSKLEYGKAILAVVAMYRNRLSLAVHTGASGNKRDIKRRIRLIAEYGKKPLLWIIASVILVVLIGVVGLTSSQSSKIWDERDLLNASGINEAYEKSTAVDIKNKVDKLLEEILKNGPLMSSNAYGYIKESKAFEELISLGEPALQYMFEIFSQSNEDGLKEFVMACACAKIMGVYDEEKGIGISSGREWFYKYGKFEAEKDFQIVDADFDLYPRTTNQGNKDVILPEGTDNRNLEPVISNYILARNRRAYLSGEKAIEAHKVYRIEEKDDVLIAYMQVKFNWFGFENGTFTIVSGIGGEGIPVRMQLKKSASGEYEVVEYFEAMDGRAWERSIREMFPEDLAEQVIASRWNQKLQQELWNIQREKAMKYLKQINREDVPVVPYVEKDRQMPIYLVTQMRKDFPDWNGTREVLVRTGGRYPGINIRCVFETKCTQIGDEEYEVVLTKTWDIEINGQQPVSYWKYRVIGERVQLEESQDNDGLVLLVR